MADFFTAVRTPFPYPLQTTRLALPPFPDWWADDNDPKQLAEQWQAAGASYISLGPVLLRHDARWIDQIPALLAATDVLFATVEIADQQGQIDTARCFNALLDGVGNITIIHP